jgi:hypothetical protein
MPPKIVLHIADADFAQSLARLIAGDPALSTLPVSSSEQEPAFDPRWIYVIDSQALSCPRIKQVMGSKDPHVVLMVQAGDSASYARAWEMNVRKVVERSLPADIMRLALLSEVRRTKAVLRPGS